MPKSVVAIVGRPNVGKSTLFNRLIEERRAVVSDIPGTTRDRLFGETEWNGVPLIFVDTGGIEMQSATVEAGRRPGPAPLLEDSAPFIPLIRAQAELAIEEADLTLFLVDASTGLTGADREVAQLLRRAQRPVLVVANKADNFTREQEALEFYELGLGEVYPISAIHGRGVGDLLDVVVELLPPSEPESEIDEDVIRIAILGRPNVGKSSLLNRLLGHDRAIVSPVSGTTRDALDTEMEWGGQKLVLIDTAGIRRRGRVQQGVEKYSVLRAFKAAERADVALLVVDAVEGVTAQDTHVAGLIVEQGVSSVIVINKWDAVDPEIKQNRQQFEAQAQHDLQFLAQSPMLFVSALTGQRVDRILPTAISVVESRYQRLPTGLLNDMIKQAFAAHPPPTKQGRRLKLYFVTQAEVAPPTFVFFVNNPALIHFSYERYLENRIREVFPFPGTPIRLTFRGHQVDREDKKVRRKREK